MTHVYALLGDQLVNALGWTFVHSLWQGSLIALLMTAILSRIPASKAKLRYGIAGISLLLVLLVSIITFCFFYFQAPEAAVAANQPLTWIVTEQEASTSLYAWIAQYNPFLVSVWIMGVAFFAVRFIFGLTYLRHLKTTALPVTAAWQERLDRIAQQIGFEHTVTLAESALLKIPVVVGYMKPVVLFPVGIVNQLQVEEVEAILAHEVAHLMRNDFLQNLFQSLIEMVFYYHPAVWWISAVVRSERENCCDDLAVQVCNNSLTYAKALVQLEDISVQAPPALALPFAGSKGHLLNRIKRILNQPQNKSNVMEKIVATAILLGCVTLLSFSEKKAQEYLLDIQTSVTVEETVHDSVPAQREVTVLKTVDGKDIEMHSKNGEIQSLKINGEIIDPSEYAEHQDAIEEMESLSDMAPVPPAPPVPPVPPAPPFPPSMAIPPMPPAPVMPPMPALPPVPPVPAPPAMNYYNFSTPMPGASTKRATTIVREKEGSGYSYTVINSDGATGVEIDEENGIAYVNGEEIVLDADSVFVFEEQESGPFMHIRGRGQHPMVLGLMQTDSIPHLFHMDKSKMTPEQRAEWDAYERAMEDYEKQMQKWGEEWGEQWGQGHEAEWKAYEKDMEEWGKTWEQNWNHGNSAEWKEYEKAMEAWSKDFDKTHGEHELRAMELQGLNKSLYELRELAPAHEGVYNDAVRERLAYGYASPDVDVMEIETENGERFMIAGPGQSHAFSTRPDRPFSPLTTRMDRDGLIDAEGSYSIVLEADKLRINGKRMPDEVHQKYLEIFERTQGYPVSGKTKIEISQ